MKSKYIAISAISAALIAIILSIGSYFTFSDLFCVVISSIVVVLPIALETFKGSVLAFLVGGVVATLICLPTFAFSFVIPAYFVFFGIYPIVKELLVKRNVKKIVVYVIGCVWCVAMFYGLYFYYTIILALPLTDIADKFLNIILYLIAPVGVVFFVVYDRFLQVVKILMQKYLYKYISNERYD